MRNENLILASHCSRGIALGVALAYWWTSEDSNPREIASCYALFACLGSVFGGLSGLVCTVRASHSSHSFFSTRLEDIQSVAETQSHQVAQAVA